MLTAFWPWLFKLPSVWLHILDPLPGNQHNHADTLYTSGLWYSSLLNWYGCPWFVCHHVKKCNELKLHITCYNISCIYVTARFVVFTSFP